MARAEFDKVINAYPELKVMRRKAALATGGALLGLTTLVGGTADMGSALFEKTNLIDQYVNPEHPLMPESPQLMLERTVVEERASDLLTKHKSDEARNYMDSKEYQEVIRKTNPVIERNEERARAIDQVIKERGSPTLRNFVPTLFSLGASALGGYLLWIQAYNIHLRGNRTKEHIRNQALTFHPEWEDHPPSEQEIIDFQKPLQYLPPVGGKIPVYVSNDPGKNYISKRGHLRKLDPSRTAEEQVAELNRMKNIDTELHGYVHQMTVQGQLPDRFKYAALALIINSPFRNDWTTPMFDAPWGKVAPLIHDGGVTETSINPLWSQIDGRTDFLQRVVIVHTPEIDALKQLSPTERQKLPIALQIKAGQELSEEDRLTTEAKFYQRAALALHSAEGTAPRKIPSEIRSSAALIWQEFEASMRDILRDYQIEDIGDIRWFQDKPRELKHLQFGKRYEAEWEPIQSSLIRLEDIKTKHPEIQERVGRLLRAASQGVDQAIGLLPAA